MNPSTVEVVASVLFGVAILHTFSIKRFQHLAHQYPEGSIRENLFHFLGEVEAVFGLWAAFFILAFSALAGKHDAVEYLESRNYTEPAFVFVIMAMAASTPVLRLVNLSIAAVAKLLPLAAVMSFFVVTLSLGPLLGSFVTEPAAMTVVAIILLKCFYSQSLSKRFKYSIIGTLFVNISIGGVLTNFAAPPVLMVAGTWKWDTMHMLTNYGYKAVIAVLINVVFLAYFNRKEISTLSVDAIASAQETPEGKMTSPWWLIMVHVGFLGGVVYFAHHMVVFLGIFLFFLAMVDVTKEYQEKLKLRESLLVGFFLGGLVTLGGFQQWWLQPLISSLGDLPLFIGATGLTAITDNAALTYLGSLVEGLSDASKYALVAGAVAGGGLTVIANAPNPAGYGILKNSFGEEGISPLGLLLGALRPTAVAMVCLWLLP